MNTKDFEARATLSAEVEEGIVCEESDHGGDMLGAYYCHIDVRACVGI